MDFSKVSYEDEGFDVPVKVKPKNDEQVTNFSDRARDLLSQERFWATLAHAIGPVMIALLFWGDGPQWLGLLLVSAGIYFYYSDKSPYVKHHARQALALQLMGTIGWFVVMFGLVVIGIPVWIVLMVVSALLIVVLVGIILLPIAILSWPLLMLATFVMPLGTAILGAIGAWETWHGRDYNYPRLAAWLDKKFGVCYKLV
ncbi:MAG: DUF4870 domain-containing protein [Anaerolineae bacterium]|nr:DUF4870 domain-containing protein [Anaerolineae bacterium]